MPPPPRAIKVTDEHGYGDLLQRLIHCKVEFVLIGGLAAIARGSNRATFDIDVVYERSAENMRRLVDAIGELDPYLRGAPPGLQRCPSSRRHRPGYPKSGPQTRRSADNPAVSGSG